MMHIVLNFNILMFVIMKNVCMKIIITMEGTHSDNFIATSPNSLILVLCITHSHLYKDKINHGRNII